MNQAVTFKILQTLLLAGILGVLADIAGSLATIASPPTHNAEGGSIEQCGDLPGLVGDDC